MKIVYAYSYRSLPFISGNETFKLDYVDSPSLRSQLAYAKYEEDSTGAIEWFYNLDRYARNDVKKLYIKNGSSKKVPKQVWAIETTHFETNPVQFFEKYNTEFEEF